MKARWPVLVLFGALSGIGGCSSSGDEQPPSDDATFDSNAPTSEIGADAKGAEDAGRDTKTAVDGKTADDATSDSRVPTDDVGFDAKLPDGGCIAATTTGGATLPTCWSLKVSDRFGTGAGATVGTLAQLHAKYYEGQFYNRDTAGLVRLPNVVINHEQQTYSHFETSIVFATDHLTIQGRGHPDGSITSAEIVSVREMRDFCVEARYQIPRGDKSWPAFWIYAAKSGGDSSELDFEQPVTPGQGVHDVSLYNHPGASSLVIADSKFTTPYMTWHDATFDASTAPHVYTACYEDAAKRIMRFIDGKKIYTGEWQWNASLGGTGHGPDASAIVNLAVGGDWPGALADTAHYSGDVDLYSLEYYGP